MKQLEYRKEGEARIKLGEIERQILQLSNNDDDKDGDEVQVELSAGEKVYRNELVSTSLKYYNFHFFFIVIFKIYDI